MASRNRSFCWVRRAISAVTPRRPRFSFRTAMVSGASIPAASTPAMPKPSLRNRSHNCRLPGISKISITSKRSAQDRAGHWGLRSVTSTDSPSARASFTSGICNKPPPMIHSQLLINAVFPSWKRPFPHPCHRPAPSLCVTALSMHLTRQLMKSASRQSAQRTKRIDPHG